jgi:hypothetical protein
MSKKAIALEILAAGGYFRKALESSYYGGEKFATRLYRPGRIAVKGIGIKTLWALEDEGLLKKRSCPKSSTWGEEWVLNEEATS